MVGLSIYKIYRAIELIEVTWKVANLLIHMIASYTETPTELYTPLVFKRSTFNLKGHSFQKWGGGSFLKKKRFSGSEIKPKFFLAQILSNAYCRIGHRSSGGQYRSQE